MHSNDWNADSAGNIQVNDADAYILNNPNPACQPITITYSGYGDSDAMAPLAGAEMPLSWTSNPGDAAMITYDTNPAPEGGQIVFLTFNYLAADQGRYALLENSIHWLLAQEIGDCSVSGQAMLAGETNHAGITVSAIPNGGTVTTGADGSFSFPGLFAGTYQIRASKDGWATQVSEVTLVNGQVVTDISLVLTPTAEVQACSAPGSVINDNTTITDTVTIDTIGTISEVIVDLDITHTYQGDLVVSLTSPTGTEVVLHNRSGGSTDNIVGTYPTTLQPAEDLGLFIGEEMIGDWMLTVSDLAGGDQGTLNQWCVTIIYDGGVVAVGAQPMDAAVAQGGMGLSWNYNPAMADGFNVYRRVEGASATRLNEDLLTSSSGHIDFVDSGEGLSQGQVVFYSYGMVLGGTEIGRSEEVEVEFTSGLPTVFALRGNYPNPFNPMTTIKFDMPRQAHVKLTVYDIAGRMVKTLVDEVRPAATHTVVWDGSDRNGRRVASGTYYYVVQSDSFRAVQKMMLVK
jgi:subtilisin-like proprotein convertase family protein